MLHWRSVFITQVTKPDRCNRYQCRAHHHHHSFSFWGKKLEPNVDAACTHTQKHTHLVFHALTCHKIVPLTGTSQTLYNFAQTTKTWDVLVISIWAVGGQSSFGTQVRLWGAPITQIYTFSCCVGFYVSNTGVIRDMCSSQPAGKTFQQEVTYNYAVLHFCSIPTVLISVISISVGSCFWQKRLCLMHCRLLIQHQAGDKVSR